MSQSVIGALRVNLGLDAAQFSRGARQAQSTMERLGRNMQRVGAAISAVGAGIALAVRGQINAMDEMAKASQRIGVPVEALSQLQHAAELSGVSMSTLQGSLQRLSRNMVERAADFAALGISVRDASGNMRPTVDVLQDVADRLSAMPEGAERTALAMDLMGRAGAEMIPLLAGGGNAIRDMMAEADRLGLTISTQTAQAAERFNDNLLRLQRTITGLWRQISAALIPVLEGITQTLVDLSARFAGLTEQQQQWAAAIAGITIVAGPALIAVGSLIRALTMLRVALALALGPWGILLALATAAGAAFLTFNSEAEPVEGTLEGVAVAQDALNVALGTFASTSAPAAGREAYSYARNLERQAAAALQAAEAEFALMQAELARFQNAPIEERGLLGDMEEGAMRRNLADAQGQIQGLRDTLDNARQTMYAISREMNAMGESATSAAYDLEEIVVNADSVTEALAGAGGAARQVADVDIPDLTVSLEDLASQMKQVESSFESAFVNFVTGTQSAREAIGNLLRDLARLAAQSAFRGLFGGMFGGGDGLLAGIFGGARAMGGPVSAGKAYLVGERGPELFMPKAGGQIVPNHSMGGAQQVVVRLELSGDIDARIQQGAQGVAVEVVREYDRSALPGRVQQISRDPRKRG